MFAKRAIRLPTIEENSAINRGIAADPDTVEISERNFARLKPIQKISIFGVNLTGDEKIVIIY